MSPKEKLSSQASVPALNQEQTRARILCAASKVFAEKGFYRASTREICRLAGVNNAAINYYFGNKVQLYSEVLRHPLRRMTEVALAVDPAQTDLRSHLRAFIRSILLSLATENEETARHHRIIAREFIEPTGLCESMRTDMATHFRILRTLVATKLPQNHPPIEIDRLCLAIVGQAMFFARSKPTITNLSKLIKLDVAGVEQLAERLTDFACNLITAEAETAKVIKTAKTKVTQASSRLAPKD